MWSLSECIPWMTVGLAESVVIVTLNLCTIIVFVRNRNLRKRSTLLVINLAVIDMFVGGIAVSFLFFYYPGIWCNLWKDHFSGFWFYFYHVLIEIFLFGSFINIAIIALERVHATFFPFRHRVLKKCVYGLIIGVVWVTSGLISIANDFLFEVTYHAFYLLLAVFSICLLIMCVSYTSIVIKVRCSTQPQHHGAASRERKLTMTFLIVTVASLLLCLPYVVLSYSFYLSNFKIFSSMSHSELMHLPHALLFLFYANSLVNPILYAIRMPEYKSAFLALFRKPQEQRQDAVFPLREM